MNLPRLACLAALAALPGLALANDLASLLHPGGVCPHCNCQEQIVYQDAICHRCVLVPDNKPIKKIVYEVKEVPFCLKKLPPLFSLLRKQDCCEDACCPECACPRYKKVLIKKEITCGEVCGTRCRIEEYVTRVPCRVCTPGCLNCTELVVPVASGPVAPPAPGTSDPNASPIPVVEP
ncbi:MAG: hypothetical protein SFU86_11280 [Pirellulaceae bacterium]|nr:hypothetical protein [Pirellulaceae bacterium]